jgi:hypothetical protein
MEDLPSYLPLNLLPITTGRQATMIRINFLVSLNYVHYQLSIKYTASEH